VEVAAGSDVGVWQRQQSDAHLIEELAPNVTLLAVADGFGLVGKGTPTAVTALGVLREYLRKRQRGGAFGRRAATPSHVRTLLLAALDHANARVYAQSGANEDFVASGTSMTVVLIVGYQAFIAHVGDARAYLVRLGHAESLTADDAMFDDPAIASGKMSAPAKPRMSGLLWRTLGTQSKLEASIADIELLSGDELVLCTDGVHHRVEADEVASALEGSATASDAVQRILLRARARDNVENGTVVVARGLVSLTPGFELGPSRLDLLRSTIVLVLLATCAISFALYVYRFGLLPH
jgi:serine/threonine protein phosphatase PrpC